MKQDGEAGWGSRVGKQGREAKRGSKAGKQGGKQGGEAGWEEGRGSRAG